MNKNYNVCIKSCKENYSQKANGGACLMRYSTCKIRTTLGEERTLNFTIDFLATCDKTEHLLDVILEPLFTMKLAICTLSPNKPKNKAQFVATFGL